MIKKFKGIIFDLDGTLLNTLEDLADTLNIVLAEAGLPTHSVESCRSFVGGGLKKLIERAAGDEFVVAKQGAMVDKFINLYQANQLKKTHPYAGIVELLANLKRAGYKLGVLSNKNDLNTQIMVEHFFSETFDVVCGFREGVPLKPNPAGGRAVAREMGISPSDIMYVGDSGVDMETARAAGFLPVGVEWGYRSREELSQAGAEIILGEPAYLLELLEALAADVPQDIKIPKQISPPPLATLVVGRMVTKPASYALRQPDILAKLKSAPGALRVALTGGVCSGKSTVASIWEELGARHIDFDNLSRCVVAPNSPGLAAVVDLLGEGVVGSDGQLDRATVAAAVFADSDLRLSLEGIIHPLVWGLMGEELEALAGASVVVSIPLLFEAGLESFFSPIVLVHTSQDVQLQRLAARQPHLSLDEAQGIINSQWPSPPKIMGSSFVISNSGNFDDLATLAKGAWEQLMG